ncbi:putative EscI/YscI/HrpB family type III secretion system inner rod protein [Gammaproteobacteria bacterium]
MWNSPLLAVGITPSTALASPPPTAAPIPPSPEAVERFQNALAPEAGPQVVDLGQVRYAQVMQAPGDVILKGMEEIRGEYLSRKQGLGEFLEGKRSLDSGELLRMQFDLVMASFYIDWVSKVASKTTQNLDTLLKTQ